MSVTCLGDQSNQHKHNNHKGSSDPLHNLATTQIYTHKHNISIWFKHRHVCMHECINLTQTRLLGDKVLYDVVLCLFSWWCVLVFKSCNNTKSITLNHCLEMTNTQFKLLRKYYVLT